MASTFMQLGINPGVIADSWATALDQVYDRVAESLNALSSELLGGR
jgi:hypothetical protein